MQNENNKTWTTNIEDAGDGSGDGILTLPSELCELKGWKEGTVLKMTVENGVLVLEEVLS